MGSGDGDAGAAGFVGNLVGHAADEKPLEIAVAVTSHDDDVGLFPVGDVFVQQIEKLFGADTVKRAVFDLLFVSRDSFSGLRNG